MKLRKYFFIFILFITSAVFFITPRNLFAQENFSSGNTPTLQKSQTVNEDYFSAGGTVVISGTVNGDVYAAGGNVLVDGIVNGDVLAAGGNVTVNGKVTGNVRAVGGQILVGADVGKNITTTGGTIVIQDTATISGSLTAVGGNISVLSSIGKGATFAGNQVSIDNAIGGNVNATVQNLQMGSGSHIAGSLNYWSNAKMNFPAGVAEKGITYHQTNFNAHSQSSKEASTGFGIVWDVISFASAFIIGILLLWLAPLLMINVTTTIAGRLGTSFLLGLAAIVIIPIACVFLLVTIVGIPIAFILVGIFLLFVYLNKIFISYTIGKKLLPQKNVLALLVGLVMYGVISIIPILGSLWGFVALCIGLGAFVLTQKNFYLQGRAKKLF